MDGEFSLQVDDGIRGVVILNREIGIVAPEIGLVGVESAGLVEEGAGSSPILIALGPGRLADVGGGGGIVFGDGGGSEIGSGGCGGDELDVGFAVEAGVFEPLVIGLPLGGGNGLLEDLDFAVGGEDAVFEFVGFVEGGEGGFGVDGGREVGGPAFGQGHDGVVGFDEGEAEFDGRDGRIFLVDIGEAYGRELRDDAEVIPIAGLVALVVVGDMDGGEGVFGSGELGVGDLAAEGHGVGDALHEVVPLGGRDGAKSLAEDDFLVAAEVHDDLGVGGAFVVEGADGFEVGRGWEGRSERGGVDASVAGGGDDEGLLVADDGVEEAEGRDFGGGVEPDGLAVDVGEGDGVVEGGGRGDGGIEGDAGADEDSVCVDTGGRKHGDEERGLVFAVAVLVAEDVAGGMRLDSGRRRRLRRCSGPGS